MAAMTISASYLARRRPARDEIDWNPEFSRRARGYTVYAAMRTRPRAGWRRWSIAAVIIAAALVTGIGGLPGAEVLWVSELNQGLVRFLDPRAGASEEDHDRFTDRVIAGINATGEAFFSGTTWRGRRAMRVSVVNWRTNERVMWRGPSRRRRRCSRCWNDRSGEQDDNGNREQGALQPWVWTDPVSRCSIGHAYQRMVS